VGQKYGKIREELDSISKTKKGTGFSSPSLAFVKLK
jgi:hypothetical protein